jgi:BirA family biotin operon repressor/biotin-[acetyl-CoA-carboxylase] ligase
MQIMYLDEVNSTNTYAKERLDELAHATVVCAKRQSAGHGQFERKWVDLGGENLFFSIVLKPEKIDPDLTIRMAQAVVRALADYGVCAQIKPPNDVLVNGAKIAGVLAESITRGGDCKGVVLGAGVNLNVHEADLARVSDQEVTALNLEAGAAADCKEFLNKLLTYFGEAA